MGRVLLPLSLILLSSGFLGALAALRAWSEGDDVWGLLYALIGLCAGLAAQRLFEPQAKGDS